MCGFLDRKRMTINSVEMIETDQVDAEIIERTEIAFLAKIQMRIMERKSMCYWIIHCAGLGCQFIPLPRKPMFVMNDDISIHRLQDPWRECERNIYYLCNALTSLDPVLPMEVEKFDHLTDTPCRLWIDSFCVLQNCRMPRENNYSRQSWHICKNSVKSVRC